MKNGTIRSRTSLGALVLLVVCAASWSSSGTAAVAPAAGCFLVATRQQQGFFARTVILLVAYDSNGTFGLIVNRPTELPLTKLLPHVNALQGRADSIYVGGPVSLDRLTLLIQSKVAPPDAIHVLDDIYASGSLKALRAVAGNKLAGARFRAYGGYAGWGPGQLDAEIAQGGWVVIPANANDVFNKDSSGLWDKLIKQQDLILVDAGHPGLIVHRIGQIGLLSTPQNH
ncbi:MAG: YqgE/AlgH family protein [Gammaproteobacteria bacterium]